MSIGTAKPTVDEQGGVKHYFIDSHSIQEPLTSGKYEKEALSVLEHVFSENDHAVLVGGSGMFINAILYGTDQLPQDPKVREELNHLHKIEGLDFLLSELEEKDPVYFNEVDKENPVRVIRSLEVIRITDHPYSDQRQGKSRPRPFSINYFVIDHDREVLYDRINKRVDLMIKEGLFEEVISLSNYKSKQPLNTVGYKEIFDHLDGNISLERAVELIKRNTRRYAKRQLTWFRRDENAIWIPYSSNQGMINQLLQHLKR